MSEEQDKRENEAPPEREPEGPTGGERLAQARREQQISVLEIAKELHLDEAKVRALERNDFDFLGAAVFAKGHLRKYAQLVGVDEDDVFTDYYKMTHTADLPPVVIGRPKIRRELSPIPWIVAGVVIILVAAAYWWFAASSRDVDDAAPPAAPASEETKGAAPDAASEFDTDSTEPAGVAAEAPRDQAAQPVREPQPEPLAEGRTRLQLTFSGDCWTEISDATGQRLFFNMGRAGRTVELAGTAPFSVLFGNADNVSVLVDGTEYPVAPTSPGSRTARMTIIKP